MTNASQRQIGEWEQEQVLLEKLGVKRSAECLVRALGVIGVMVLALETEVRT